MMEEYLMPGRSLLSLICMIPLVLFGCNGNAVDFDKTFEGAHGTVKGSVAGIHDFYDVTIGIRNIETDQTKEITLGGGDRTRWFEFQNVPLGTWEVYAQLTAKPDLPEPPRDQLLLEPPARRVVLETDRQSADGLLFKWTGEVDTLSPHFNRGHTWGSVKNVPGGYDVILSVTSPSITYRRRLGGSGSTRNWNLKKLPPEAFQVTCMLYHRPGASFAPPGKWFPERIVTHVQPGFPTKKVVIRWESVVKGVKTGSVSGTVKDVPGNFDVVVVAERDGLKWMANATGLLFGKGYKITDLPPGAFVVSCRLWDRSQRRWVQTGGQWKPNAKQEVSIAAGKTLSGCDFRWVRDVLKTK